MSSVVGENARSRLSKLAHRFRQQHKFSENYSQLYAALFGTVAGWLSERPAGPVAHWLLDISSDRAAFDVSNLLAAGLHHEVLTGNSEVSTLAAFYPTVGGDASSEHLFQINEKGARTASPGFIAALHKAILARKEALAVFLQTKTVQTNETGRGISWLLPLCFTQWDGAHLIDLGASAGLNLIAENRDFQFVDELDPKTTAKFGRAASKQFSIHGQGNHNRLVVGKFQQLDILSRTGCDLHPFRLRTKADETVLASYIWADQVERMHRLREAIAAFHQVQQGEVPVRLLPVALPDQLPGFLDQQSNTDSEPLLIYNTYIKMYLPGKGQSMREMISKWAAAENRPVVWTQWEPPQFTSFTANDAPQYGWLAWTADLWHNNEHQHFQLGWVHPHGRFVQWLPGLQAWAAYWST